MLTRRKGLSFTALLVSQLCVAGVAAAQETSTPASTQTPTEQVGATPTADPAAEEVGGAKKKQVEEEVVVTGSRIRRKDLTTPAPVTVLSREQITASGVVSIGDFLQTLPEQGNALNTSVNNGGDGSTRINLRGLGQNRTLVLLNGRRVVAGGTGADATVDLNSIPTAAIERVEILKDGASAVYGSDAIAGVVNIITKKRLNGTELSAYGGVSQHGDANTYDLAVTTGTAGDRGSILFSAGYTKQESFFAAARDWAGHAVRYNFTSGLSAPFGSSAIPQGRFTFPKGACSSGASPELTAKCQAFLTTNGITDAASHKFTVVSDANSGTPGATYRALKGTDTFNFQAVNYLLTPQQRVQLFSTGEAKVGSNARGYFEASYVNRQSDQLLAPEPLFVGPAFGTNFIVSGANLYNPTGADLPDVRRRLVELKGRHYTQDIDTFRVVAGVDGTLPDALGPVKGWFWDLSFNYGRTTGTSTTDGTLRNPKIADAVGPSFLDNGVPRCGTAANGSTPAVVIANCVPLDLFHGPGSITQNQVSNLSFTGINRGFNQMAAVQALLSGEIVRIASDRPVALALGYDFRREYAAFVPNPIQQANEDSDNNSKITTGSYNVNEAFGELTIPLLSGIVGVEDLEASAALRYSHYSTFGGNTTYKFGGRYRPVRDITLRATYGTGFRAPNIGELYAGNADSFEGVTDPCAKTTDPKLIQQCGAAANNGDDRTQIKSQVGGNAKLKPETAKILTMGVVLEPSFVKNLSLTVDYYNIVVDQSISAFGSGVILQQCYPGSAGTPNADLCKLITRDPASGLLSGIIDTGANVGGDSTSGIDAAIRYSLPTDYGRFGGVIDVTWLQKFDRTLAGLDATGKPTVVQARGTYDLGVYPQWKWNAGLTWAMGGLNAAILGRYIGNYKECADGGGTSSGSGLCYQQTQPIISRDVGSYVTFDAYLAYALKSSFGTTTFAAGIKNALNQNPPFVYDNGFTFSDPSAYDYVGRFVYARVAQNF